MSDLLIFLDVPAMYNAALREKHKVCVSTWNNTSAIQLDLQADKDATPDALHILTVRYLTGL